MEVIKTAIYNDNRELLLDQLEPGSTDNNTKKLCAIALFLVIEREFDKKQSNSMENTKELVKLLLDLGANVNATYNTSTVFGYACAVASAEIVLMMFDYGADLDLMDKSNSFPVERAFSVANEPVANLFIELGIDADLVNRLHLLHQVLRSGKASMDIVTKLVRLGADVNSLDKDGWTVLDAATETGNVEISRFLLDHGAAINKPTRYIFTVLDNAVRKDQIDIVKLLLERKIDVFNGDGNVIADAARNGNHAMFKLLMSHHDLMFHGRLINKALFDAVETSSLEFIQLLLDHHADINGANSEMTPLMKAMRLGRTDVCCLLIKHMVFWKATRGYVIDENWKAVKASRELVRYRVQCEDEMKVLKKKRFNEFVRYLDVMRYRDDDITLAFLAAREENVVRIVRSDEFVREFPIFGSMMVEKLNKALDRFPLGTFFKRAQYC